MNREQEQTVKRRRVPDPHQRTITGGTVHLLWRIVSILLVVSMFLGVVGGGTVLFIFILWLLWH